MEEALLQRKDLQEACNRAMMEAELDAANMNDFLEKFADDPNDPKAGSVLATKMSSKLAAAKQSAEVDSDGEGDDDESEDDESAEGQEECEEEDGSGCEGQPLAGGYKFPAIRMQSFRLVFIIATCSAHARSGAHV